MNRISERLERSSDVLTATIPTGGTDSNLVDVRHFGGLAIKLPAGFTTANLTLLSGTSATDASPVAPKDKDGNTYVITSAAAGEIRIVPADGSFPLHYVGFRASVAQTGGDVITIYAKG